MELSACPTLTHSSLLMHTSEHVLGEGVTQRTHTAYTLRLPLADAERSAGSIAQSASDSQRANELTEQNGAAEEEPEYLDVCLEAADISQVEQTFWERLVALVDWDHSGTLDRDEFCELMRGVLAEDSAAVDGTIERVWREAARTSRGAEASELTPQQLAKARPVQSVCWCHATL